MPVFPLPALAGRVLAAPDADLLDRYARAGDEAAFELLVWRHGRLVWGVCRRVARDRHGAEDAFQAAFLALARKAGTITRADGLAGWLYRVAYRAAVAARRGPGRPAPLDGVEVPDPAPGPADAAGWRDAGRAVAEEVSRLPAAYRASFVLCEVQGLSNAQAAAALGCPVGTVESRLTRARARLRERLSARGVTVAGAVLVGGVVPEAVMAAGVRAGVGVVPARVAALAGRACRSGVGAKLFAAAAVAVLAGSALVGMTRDDPPAAPPGPKPAAVTADGPAVRFGPTAFRAGQPIGDARYLPGGKQVVGYASPNLHVWDAGTGAAVRTIPTGLERADGPSAAIPWLAFAVHPTRPLVAAGGTKAGRATLQVWDAGTGERLAETAAAGDHLLGLAWTPDGRLLERSNVGRDEPPAGKTTGWKLVVRDDRLGLVKAHDLPDAFGSSGTVVRPLPGGRQAVLWQYLGSPTVFDLETGGVVRTLAFKPRFSSGLGVSPDGKTALVTSSEEMVLLDLAGDAPARPLPVLRKGWYMPRPLFSPDGRTVYVFDFKPMAYDVATGEEKWRAKTRTMHGVGVHLCDLSPDGKTLLVRHGQGVSFLDAATGEERDLGAGPSSPPDLTWSPDGSTVFTRVDQATYGMWDADRTWTAWDAATGKPRYVLRPTGYVEGNEWKFTPDLFFLAGGREVVAGLTRSESVENWTGPPELVVFEVASGKFLRRLGGPLPDDPFRWAHPVAVAPDGSAVLMRQFATKDGRPSYGGGWWDPAKGVRAGGWAIDGQRAGPPRHFEGYEVTVQSGGQDPKTAPAHVRCYATADGVLAADLASPFAWVDPVGVRGPLLLTESYDYKTFRRGSHGWTKPAPPFAFDLWELPTRAPVRLFELPARGAVGFAPGGGYVLRVADDRTAEVYEPFALKAVVASFATPARVHGFEFAPDGGRVAGSLADCTIAVWDTAAWQAEIDAQLAKRVPADLGPLWDDLAKDAAAGLRAARLLGAAGDKAVSLLAGKVAAKKPVDPAAVKKLIADLGADDFATREKAEKALRALGPPAGPHLRAAAGANPPPEVGRRLGALLRALDARALTADEVRETRAVQALAWAGTPAARELMAKWAAGDPEAVLTKAAAGAPGPSPTSPR